jgi:hypothetical protein
MDDALIEEKVSPEGYKIKVDLNTYYYSITNPRGHKEVFSSTQPKVPRIVFLGDGFNLSHFFLGELVFVNAKDRKLIIPYQFRDSKDLKTILLPSHSESDVMPVILYHYFHYKEVVKATEMGYIFKHIIVDESITKSDLVNLKVRYPQVNIYIQKKKNSNIG